MGKVNKLSMLETVMPFILILFFFLNYHPNNAGSSLSEMKNIAQAANYSLRDVVKFPTFKSAASQQTPVVPAPKTADFNRAVTFTLQHEGGLVNDKSDKGGITNYGISYVFLHKLLAQKPKYLALFSLTKVAQVKPSIIKNLTMNQAIQIYNTEWWEKNHYGQIQNQAIATKAFDYSVNMGSTSAIKLLQTACQNLSVNSGVTVNGQLDNSTITYINSLNPVQANQLLYTYENVASNYYSNIAKKHPAYKKFLLGWLKRANDNNYIFA